MKNVYNIQIASLASRCCLALACFFCQFQFGVAYKSVAYKKACIQTNPI